MKAVKHDRRGRPEKLTLARVTALVELSNRTGRTFKAIAAERHIPYVSMIAALKRHGLSPRAVLGLPKTKIQSHMEIHKDDEDHAA